LQLLGVQAEQVAHHLRLLGVQRHLAQAGRRGPFLGTAHLAATSAQVRPRATLAVMIFSVTSLRFMRLLQE
jgi:hypothetical protein